MAMKAFPAAATTTVFAAFTAALAAVFTLAGCGFTSGTGTRNLNGASTPPSAAISTSASMSMSSSAAPLTLDEHANRTTVTVSVGSTIVVSLHSTYWSTVASSAPDVLQADGSPSTLRSPSCLVGLGCGTVTAVFTALAPGSALLTSARSSCGEALRCSPDQSTYTVTVDVTRR